MFTLLSHSALILTLLLTFGGCQRNPEKWRYNPNRGRRMNLNLEGRPLEILSNSTLGSGDKLAVQFKNATGRPAGGIKIMFGDVASICIDYCEGWQTVELPESTSTRIWTITHKMGNGSMADQSLVVACNGIKVLEYDLSLADRAQCITTWAEQVTRLRFRSDDNATLAYRVQPAHSDDGWSLHSFSLIKVHTDTWDLTNPGLLLAYAENNGTIKHGFVCDDEFDQHTADVICRTMDYDFAVKFTTLGEENFAFYPNVTDDDPNRYAILMDETKCSISDEEFEDCEHTMLHHDCTHDEDVVLYCGSDNPPTTSPEPPTTTWVPPTPQTTTWAPPTPPHTTPLPPLTTYLTIPPDPETSSPPLDDEVAAKLGESKASMKMSPKKGRIHLGE